MLLSWLKCNLDTSYPRLVFILNIFPSNDGGQYNKSDSNFCYELGTTLAKYNITSCCPTRYCYLFTLNQPTVKFLLYLLECWDHYYLNINYSPRLPINHATNGYFTFKTQICSLYIKLGKASKDESWLELFLYITSVLRLKYRQTSYRS